MTLRRIGLALGICGVVALALTPHAWASAGGLKSASGPGTRLWVELYPHPSPAAQTDNAANAVAVSPDGSRVFVTGRVGTPSHAAEFGTVAYDAPTGHQDWVNLSDAGVEAVSLAVSPTGATLYATGTNATIAYNATTGTRRWSTAFAPTKFGGAASVTVSPDGKTVFVTGDSQAPTGRRYRTAAYAAATGKQLWVRTYTVPGVSGIDVANDLKVTLDGSTLIVTGTVQYNAVGQTAFGTVAYNAATGAQRWVQLFKAPRSGADEGGLALSPDGKTAFVTGWGGGTASHPVVYETVAYATATGTQVWASSYAHGAASEAHSVAVSPDGTTVFVTGASDNVFEGSAFATVAYRASSGAQLWASRYRGKLPGFDSARQLAVSPDGTRLIVTGSSNVTPGAPQPADYTTVAYATRDGTRLWARRYAGFNMGTTVRAVAVSPDGSTVFVTGSAVYKTPPGGDGLNAFATVAYRF